MSTLALSRVPSLKAFTAITMLATVAGMASPAGATAGAPDRSHSACGADYQYSSDAGYTCAQPGDLIEARIGDLHPTQPSLGKDEVYYKLGRFAFGKDAINKKFDEWCESNGQLKATSAAPGARLDDPASFTCQLPLGQETPASLTEVKTVVVGPGGKLYLTDGHHTLTTFYETSDGGPNLRLRFRVLDNLSQLSPQDFWAQMRSHKWAWLRDANGKPVTAEQLPSSPGLANFGDDPYRSLMYFSRDIGFTAGTIPFQEFYWGAWLRDSKPVDLSTWDRNSPNSYLEAVKKITKAQAALPGDALVDSGWTAKQLGVLSEWNDGKPENKGEFAKLAKPFSDDKPGKIAYALEYKRRHGR